MIHVLLLLTSLRLLDCLQPILMAIQGAHCIQYVFVEDASVKTFSIGIRSKLFGIFETKWVSYQSRFNSCGPEQASCQPARYCVTVYKRGSLYQGKIRA